MQLSLVGQLPRLARTLVSRLLDQEAAVVTGDHPIGTGDQALGLVTSVAWQKDRVTVQGRHAGDRITLSIDGQPEHDLTSSPFQITLPRLHKHACVRLTCTAPPDLQSLYLAPPDPRDMRRARLGALPLVMARVLGERREILAYLRTGNPNIALGVRRRLGLTDRYEGTYIPGALFAPSTPPTPRHPPAIVIPVYNAFEDIDRLLSSFPDGAGCAHHLVLVDDGSDDPRVLPCLQANAKAHPDTCTLVRLPENKGFVAAANAGIKTAQGLTPGDVILLNSDTLPPATWVPRLLAPMHQDRTVASVTPMSNAAEILSVPWPGATALTGSDMVDQIDTTAESLSPAFATADIPTGIGFCMALNRHYLNRVGLFDAAFGRGYGEEVDWCQRARAMGGRNVGTATLFVGHSGSASFGAAEKAARRKKASAEISRRYPSYDSEVQAWCVKDPLASARLALTIAWLGAQRDSVIPVFFGHSLGGGAETALAAEINASLSKGCPGVVIIRVGGPRPWRVEVQTGEARWMGEVADQGQVLRLLQPLRNRRVIYSCGVGAVEPAVVPRFLLRLVQLGVPFEMRLHDFFPISPSWNLLGSDGVFHGVPDKDTRDPAHRVDGKNPLVHRDWRLLWNAVIHRAQVITAFSRSSADLFSTAYPEAKARVVVDPHQPCFTPAPVPLGGQNVGVLGSINRAKGGQPLVALGASLRHRRLCVLGEMDGQFRLDPPHSVHGRYRQSEISDLAQSYGIGVWLIPSVCPETFSFATHEALATGLPVLGFDIGAQGEALRAAENGIVLPYASNDTQVLLQSIETAFDGQTDTRLRSAS